MQPRPQSPASVHLAAVRESSPQSPENHLEISQLQSFSVADMAQDNRPSEFLYDGFLNDTRINLTLGYPHWNFSSESTNRSHYGNWSTYSAGLNKRFAFFEQTHIRVIFSLLYGLACATCVLGKYLFLTLLVKV